MTEPAWIRLDKRRYIRTANFLDNDWLYDTYRFQEITHH